MSRHFVCSDVHLGLPFSREDFFYKDFLPRLQPGDELILLGDILDYWISARDVQLSTAVDSCKDLHNRLVILKRNGIKIKYIPGNHDSFVFYVESRTVPDFYWSEWLFQHCEIFNELHSATREYRLSEVCDIHYPFYRVQIGQKSILFTHGHWVELTWRILAGDVQRFIPVRRLPKFWVVAAALNTCLVHKYADSIRRLYNRYIDHDDAFELTRLAEDISYCVLAEALNDRAVRNTWAGRRPTDVPDNNAIGEMYERQDIAFQQELDGYETRTRRACKERGKKLLQQWLREDPPTEQVTKVKRALNSQRYAYNYAITSENGKTKVAYEELSHLANFDVLIFGHFHKPRFVANACDDGCMLQNPRTRTVETFLIIEDDGQLVPSWPVGP